MNRTRTSKLARLCATAAVGLGVVGAAGSVAGANPGNGAGGVTGPAFYVDGELYRTVGTPTYFGNTGAPESSFDVIYALPGVQNVAEAKPGDSDYNGGRWRVHAISFDDFDAALAAVDSNDSGTFDYAEEVQEALRLGLADDDGVVNSFECPVIPLHS